MNLPERFLNWAYRQRAKLVLRQAMGEDVSNEEIFLGFLRHTPAIITDGPAGLNGSVKGVGFIPKEEFIADILSDYIKHIEGPVNDGYSQRGLELLAKHIWGEDCEKKIDFRYFGTLELAMNHTWKNLQNSDSATLLFYEPPMISFEVRCKARIIKNGPVQKFLNAQHDVYHHPNPSLWEKRPAYLFEIMEIFDNSVGKNAFGKKIFPAE
jgi:hypothetical protein